METQLFDIAAPWASRHIGRARLCSGGLDIWFGDGLSWRLPIAELLDRTGELPTGVSLDDAEIVLFTFADGTTHPMPWDFFRYRADSAYREKVQQLENHIQHDIGARLRQHRQQHGLTQTALAAMAQVGRVTVSRIETGEQAASFATLQALATALRLSLSQLLGDDVLQ